MKTQNAIQSLIWWVGLIACIAQGILGVLMQAGVVTAEMCGAIMTAFAILLQWCNGNNPGLAGRYAPPAAPSTLESKLSK